MRTPEEFKLHARKHRISYWPVRECSICGYQLGYHFSVSGNVAFDPGCDCVRYRPGFVARSWQEVANLYNLQTDPRVIEGYDFFWHFSNKTVKS